LCTRPQCTCCDGNCSYSEAISDLSSALKLKPKYKVALAQRAKLYRLLGKCDESWKDYLALQGMDPKHAVRAVSNR
jgi:Tfp pilus assembly protein PilF